MSLLSKFVKSAGTIADKINESTEKTANIGSLISNALEDQAARWDAPQQPNFDQADCFAQRTSELMQGLGIEVLAIEDYPYEKLCTLKFGQYQFKLVVLHDDTGIIVHVHCFGIGTKVAHARDAMKTLIGANLRNLPALGTTGLNHPTDQESRNLTATGKAQLLSLSERFALIVHSFDPSFVISEGELGKFNIKFLVTKPHEFDFFVRVYHKKDMRISSVYARLSEESEARRGSEIYFPLIEQIKQACAASLIGTGLQILITPNSARVNADHILEVQPVRH